LFNKKVPVIACCFVEKNSGKWYNAKANKKGREEQLLLPANFEPVQPKSACDMAAGRGGDLTGV